MSTPREPKGPVLLARASADSTGAAEPFVRLSTLPSRERADANAATYEERTGALIKRALLPEGLDGEALNRLWGRLDGGNTNPGRARFGSPLRLALAAVVLLVSGGFVGAETGAWKWSRVMLRKVTGASSLPPSLPVVPFRTPARKVALGGSDAVSSDLPQASPSAVEPPAVEPPAVVVFPRTAGATHRGPGPAREDAPVAPAPQAVVATSALAEESLLLGRALARLRQDRDPATALGELDSYVARFPSGVLAEEAARARIDALLMAERLPEARTALSKLTLGNGARDRELRLIRAELGAGSACATAVRDYETVLAESPGGSLAERALWGRAACRARLGDEAGARADLTGYLKRFPDGPHATAARARLGN